MIWLLELEVYNSGVETLYFSDRGYTTGPAESPANTNYQARIQQPANVERRVPLLGGAGEDGAGEIVLINSDGALDYLIDYGLDGRSVKLLRGDKDGARASFTEWLTGTVDRAELTFDRLTLRLRPRSRVLEVSIQENLYAGTNSGPTGIEGTADDIKGRPKPLCFGECENITPVAVNTSTLIYQIHDGEIDGVVNVWDQGAALTFDADYANLAALQAAAVPAGHYGTCLALGLFKLGSSPQNPITAHVRGAKDGGVYKNTAGDLLEFIATEYGGVTEIDTAAFTALASANTDTVGRYYTSETTVFRVMDELATDVGAVWWFKRDGELTTQQFTAPSGSAVKTINEWQVLDVSNDLNPGPGEGLPVYETRLGHTINWTVQDGSNVAGSVTDARKAFLAEEYRYETSTGSGVQTKHPLAIRYERDTSLRSGAATEAARIQALLGATRVSYIVRVSQDHATGLELMDVVNLQLSRFGLSSGSDYRLIGLTEIASQGETELELWG